MKDHVKIGHLTKYDAFRLNRDEVMNFEIWFKIHTTSLIFRQRPPKPSKLLNFLVSFATAVKPRHAPTV